MLYISARVHNYLQDTINMFHTTDMAANIKIRLSNKSYTQKIYFIVPPKRPRFLPFQLSKAAINVTLMAYAEQISSLFTRMLKIGL
jgi:hypothetical protein